MDIDIYLYIPWRVGQTQVNQVLVSLRYIAVYSGKCRLRLCGDSAQLLALDSEFGDSGGGEGREEWGGGDGGES